MPSANSEAVVTPNTKAAPTFGEGKITPANMNSWEHHCNLFFRDREIDNDKRVQKASFGFTNELLQDWYLANQELYDKNTWKEFVAAMRTRFLPRGWANAIRSEIIAKRMDVNDKFEDFILHVEKLNARLRNTDQRLQEDSLRSIVTANLVEELTLACLEGDAAAIDSYHDWKAALIVLDCRRHRIMNMVRNTINARSSGNKSSTSANSSSNTRNTGNSGNSGKGPNIPKLTDNDRKLLNDHEGCYKCRRFYTGHVASECKTWPDPATYKPLTQKLALDAKALKDTGRTRGNVATVVDDLDDDAVAAVSSASPPARASCVLGSGSDSEVCVAPLYSSHTVLRAVVLSHAVESTPMSTLIDSGAHTVLIRQDVVNRLQLRQYPLPAPHKLGNAWGTGETESKVYVRLRIALPDFSWTSVSCRAIVVPSLCAPVILGKPFLEANQIVEDHHARSLVHKPSGLNLLNPSPLPSAPTPSPAQRRLDQQDQQRAEHDERRIRHLHFLRELNSTTALHRINADNHTVDSSTIAATAIRDRVESLAYQATLNTENINMKLEFADLFPDDIPHIDLLPTDVYHRFVLKDANMTIARRQYDCPKKYREAWKSLLQQHLAAGRIRESDSPYASPAFLIPKSDPTAMPRWVNDYRVLNENTVPDMHPLPKISDILADCAKGKIWAKIDMTNSFFQTRVHPDDVKFTAVTTPFGLYEWLVMPQGCRNAPSTHQRRMFAALRPYIGTICHVYLDDIVIWSQTLEEHRRNVRLILAALRKASLFCSDKKTSLFLTELTFLGHRISSAGVQPDPVKIEKILNWPTPRCVGDVRSYLGLVRYVASFLPKLAEYTAVLTPLTTKAAELEFPAWSAEHQAAFDAIKQLVTSTECLTVIDHDDLENNRIYVSCDASDIRTGAMLSFGPTLETARPVAFDSMQFKGAELNYPVHEKELLAIVRALKKWRVDLLGVPFTVYTDHRTLENFHKQKDLSRRQARWQEFLAQYDFSIKYIQGDKNIPADVLSRTDLDIVDPNTCSSVSLLRDATRALTLVREPIAVPICATRLHVSTDPEWLTAIKNGYARDKYCLKLRDSVGTLGIREQDGLLYVGERLVIPRVPDVREGIFRCAHDALGHFGFDKSYSNLRGTYYWPKMRKELEAMYIPSCTECQRNKSTTKKPPGPLHPLPIPPGRGDCITIDWIGPLPEDHGKNSLATVTCRLGSDIRLIPCRTNTTAEEFAVLFFDRWFCENGLPLEIVSDRDKTFMSAFWRALHKLTGVKVKMSTSYHPETDGSSERTNKTVVQALRYHVARNQRGWLRALPRVRFAIMNSLNASTGFSGFQLLMGRSPRLIPPLLDSNIQHVADELPDGARLAADIIRQLDTDVLEAQDNLLAAKVAQMQAANRTRSDDPAYAVGDLVMLSTFHRRRDYMQRGDNRVAKFMVRYDGPYKILRAFPDTSVYTLDLPPHMKVFPTFHASLLKPYHPNDPDRFPSRENPRPGPIVTEDGVEEYEVEAILDRRRRGRGFQYLVRWRGWGPDADRWLPTREVQDLEALDRYLEEHPVPE